MRFPGFSEELLDLTGIENGYVRGGGIEFLDEDDLGVLDMWADEGIAFEKLSLGALAALEPAVADAPADPYLLPDCAQVRNPRHLQALIVACGKLGVRLHPHTAVRGIHSESHASMRGFLALDQKSHSPGRILVAAGAWSDALLAPTTQESHAIHPVRGQIVLLKPPTRFITRVLMHGKRYLVSRTDGRVLIGSTEEPEALFEKANTAEAVADLLEFATRMVPALASAELERCWSGLRPGSPDGLPFIGPVPGWDNVFVAAGHFRAGVQLSIGTAQAMAELFTGQTTCVPLEAFAVGRKRVVGVRAAFRS
jgi:glycine oxidase